VISPDRFNRLTGVPVVVPITTGGGFTRTAGFAVSLARAGTRTTGVVRCDQRVAGGQMWETHHFVDRKRTISGLCRCRAADSPSVARVPAIMVE